MTELKREQARQAFLASSEWADSQITALQPDASFRQYFRLKIGDFSAMLMDAPPERENVAAFLSVTRHLQQLGIRVPRILAEDEAAGFAIIEDLGDQTFTRLLADGGNQQAMYEQAVDSLVAIADHPDATRINLPSYDCDFMLGEVRLFVDWYLPAREGTDPDTSVINDYLACWSEIMRNLPDLPPTLVLRDYHVDNLIMVDGGCALLDYQDALLGSPAYDLVSLLEDARRDIPESLQQRMLERYFASRPGIDQKPFIQHYVAWGMQRHLKVAGIFTRLWLRDGKPHYLGHLDRVMKLLDRNVHNPVVAPFYQWLNDYEVSLRHTDFTHKDT